jgi:membrane protein
MKDEGSLINEFLYRFHRDEISRMSAELAYYFLLSMFPFLIFLVTFIAYLPITAQDILTLIREYAPGHTSEMIERNLHMITGDQNGKLLSFGIIATIWSASNGINAIVRAFNKAYEVKETRHFIAARLMSILLTVAMVTVMVVALLLPVFGKQIGMLIFSVYGLSEEFLHTWNAFQWLVSSMVLFLVFSFLYYFAPNKHLHWKEVVTGALFATAGWIGVSLGFSYYVSNFGNFSAMYGSLGGIIVLMIWFYLSGMIIMIGGEINAMIHCRRVKC